VRKTHNTALITQRSQALFIGESNAGVHVPNILDELGVDTRTDATTHAVRLKLEQAATV
jgi:DNA-binding NarL/FixJ family response regulator